MIGSGLRWRPPSGMPPWLAASFAVVAMMLMVSALPMLASAITPDRSDPGNDAGAVAAAAAAAAKSPSGRSSSDGASSGPGTATGSRGEAEATGRPDCATNEDGKSASPCDPLPHLGGDPIPMLSAALLLIGGGLAVLVALSRTAQPAWPGRYVRRFD